LRQDL